MEIHERAFWPENQNLIKKIEETEKKNFPHKKEKDNFSKPKNKEKSSRDNQENKKSIKNETEGKGNLIDIQI